MAARTEKKTELQLEKLDVSSLAEKTRLYIVAKKLGIESKVLVKAFAELGTKKNVQAGLTHDEINAAIAQINGADPEAPEGEPEKRATRKPSKKGPKKAAKAAEASDRVDNAGASEEEQAGVAQAEEENKPRGKAKRAVKRAVRKSAPAEESAPNKDAATGPADAESDAEEKLRYRVRKNVDNEISQIEDKVEAELAELEAESSAGGEQDPAGEPDPGYEHDYGLDIGTVDPELLREAIEESEDDFDDEYGTPLLTPMPDDEPEVYEFAPIFMAPTATEPRVSPARAERQAKDAERREDEREENREDHDERSGSRRRGRRGTSRGRGRQDRDTRPSGHGDHDEVEIIDEPRAIRGSTRIEAQRRRRAELREKGRERRHIVSQAEFLARRESVERTMVVRERDRADHPGTVTQVGVLEDGLLVEHFVTSEAQASLIGNIYLGRVQNVLPSMEAAFIDIGLGRNGVLYAGEVDWRSTGLGGRSRRIEQALKSGDQVLVQVAKDPIGHKGARLTTQISLAGRYLVYVPGGRSAGISRKLPAPERKRLKEILERVVPGKGGAIIRTAAENVPEEAIAADVHRLHDLWEDIMSRAEKEKNSKGAKPVTMYEEPNMLVKVVRDLFNEDFSKLIVDGHRPYNKVAAYVESVAPDLADRVEKYNRNDHDGQDAFEMYRIDEQIQKALSRKVWLPSGGTLVIDRTEAMTVIDVNTGKFTGSGGNLEETVTRNNLEAAEEIVRQMRLRDLGGMIVVDFIDMVLPENQELVLRRLKEALGRDRTRHQVSEVTSLGLVQMTRKRLGTGLVETFATECECCNGRGIILHQDPVEDHDEDDGKKKRRPRRKSNQDPARHPAAVAMHRHEDAQDAANSSDAAPAEDATLAEDATSIEDLAASVLVEERDEEREEVNSGTRKRRRRGSRGGRKGSAEEIVDIATAASENAERADDVEEFTSYVPDEEETAQADSSQASARSYEEAVEEFERSPRRKRKTRGNSRSDHRPRPEDFEDKPQEPAHEPEPESAPDAGRGAGAENDESRPAEAVAATSKRRRRAVRRTTVRKPARVESKAPEEVPGKQPGGEDSAVVVKTRRGRKRAVKKSVSKAAARSSAPAGSKPEAKSADKAQAKGAKGGRGRRRVARRSSK